MPLLSFFLAMSRRNEDGTFRPFRLPSEKTATRVTVAVETVCAVVFVAAIVALVYQLGIVQAFQLATQWIWR